MGMRREERKSNIRDEKKKKWNEKKNEMNVAQSVQQEVKTK